MKYYSHRLRYTAQNRDKEILQLRRSKFQRGKTKFQFIWTQMDSELEGVKVITMSTNDKSTLFLCWERYKIFLFRRKTIEIHLYYPLLCQHDVRHFFFQVLLYLLLFSPTLAKINNVFVGNICSDMSFGTEMWEEFSE